MTSNTTKSNKTVKLEKIEPQTLVDLNVTGEKKASLSGLLPVYKKYGETPLECLNRLRLKFTALKDATLSYAGRLDPLAEGLMLILVGKQFNRDREKYLSLDKEYELEVLFGISTDTADLLGLPLSFDNRKNSLSVENIKDVTASLKGKQQFHYPAFSSKAVNGKPMFMWAKENKLKEIVIPKTDVTIKSISLYSFNTVSGKQILENVTNSVALVNGDFRQEEILKRWNDLLSDKIQNESFVTCSFKVGCTSGSYMRTLAEEMGKRLGVPAMAYSIRRTKMQNVEVSQAYVV